MAGYSVVSSRYAQSLLSLAKEKSQDEAVFNDMKALKVAFHEGDELRAFLKSPVINIATKKATIGKMFSGKVSELTLMFIEKLCDVRREQYLGEIAEAYIDAYKKQQGVITAKVTTASPINEKIRQEVINIVKNNKEFLNASSIELEEKVDKNIIGGIIIKVGDKQVDASFSRKINEFKMAFSDNLYVKDF